VRGNKWKQKFIFGISTIGNYELYYETREARKQLEARGSKGTREAKERFIISCLG